MKRRDLIVGLGILTAGVAAGCSPGQESGEPIPLNSSVSVRFEPPRDLTLTANDGARIVVQDAVRVLGRHEEMREDSILVRVSSIQSAGAERRIVEASGWIPLGGGAELTVLSTPLPDRFVRATKWVAVAGAALLLVAWLAVISSSGPAT